ncbi:MAG: 4a-hydroxytetrahydrobiopterin dehydratase [Chloroflexi bacterium]|nr:4a-hydroxytetrahydrobiopterin dehydratase [Chloroflexota bacterium]
MAALSKDEIRDRLKPMDGWKLDDGELEKTYKFAGFEESMAFVNRVAALATAADHHPDISIKYDRVKLTLSTHSEGGVTGKDFALINQIDG